MAPRQVVGQGILVWELRDLAVVRRTKLLIPSEGMNVFPSLLPPKQRAGSREKKDPDLSGDGPHNKVDLLAALMKNPKEMEEALRKALDRSLRKKQRLAEGGKHKRCKKPRDKGPDDDSTNIDSDAVLGPAPDHQVSVPDRRASAPDHLAISMIHHQCHLLTHHPDATS